jgi:hypothetical protein
VPFYANGQRTRRCNMLPILLFFGKVDPDNIMDARYLLPEALNI